MKRVAGFRSLARDEAGLTLIEMLTAATMSVIIVAASCAMLINAVRDQPALSGKAQNVTTARYQLERAVREMRNAVKIESGGTSEVTLVAQVRRVSCGGAPTTDPNAEPIQCEVTYQCSGSSCTRTEAGATTIAFSGIGDTNVFCFVPSEEADPTMCGAPKEEEGGDIASTYVGINLQVPNPEGPGLLTISDGASLRTATF